MGVRTSSPHVRRGIERSIFTALRVNKSLMGSDHEKRTHRRECCGGGASVMHYKIEEELDLNLLNVLHPSLSLFLSLSSLSSSPTESRHSSVRLQSSQCKNRQRSCCASFLRYRPLSLPSPLLCSAPIQIPSVFHRTVLSFPRKITGGN